MPTYDTFAQQNGAQQPGLPYETPTDYNSILMQPSDRPVAPQFSGDSRASGNPTYDIASGSTTAMANIEERYDNALSIVLHLMVM